MLLRRFGVTTADGLPAPASARWPSRWFWRLREALAIPVDLVLALWGYTSLGGL
jgi:hypothetical protein